jgi:hypothetical protein
MRLLQLPLRPLVKLDFLELLPLRPDLEYVLEELVSVVEVFHALDVASNAERSVDDKRLREFWERYTTGLEGMRQPDHDIRFDVLCGLRYRATLTG